MTNEIMYKLLKAIEKEPKTNQRQLFAELNVCLGRINLFINELLEKGLITTEKTPATIRRACLYHLTPAGITEKTAVAKRYLIDLKELRTSIDKTIAVLEKETK